VPTPLIEGLSLVALCLLLATAVRDDLLSRKIPNRLCAALFALGLWHGAWRAGAEGAVAALLGAGTGVALLFWPFAKGAMGAGDVKLLGAIGAWTGIAGTLSVLILGSALGGLFALHALFSLDRAERAQVGHGLLNLALVRGAAVPEPSALSRERGIPFGVPLSLAAIGISLWRAHS